MSAPTSSYKSIPVEQSDHVQGWPAGSRTLPSVPFFLISAPVVMTVSLVVDALKFAAGAGSPPPNVEPTTESRPVDLTDPEIQALMALARRLLEASYRTENPLPSSLFESNSPSDVYVTLDADTLERHLLM
ncbi:hypothetical protein FRB96_007422 [Tulasnella sp. 330]|nr:hypothetical protein FRB96_007422 [Tulasnella sp. 330]